MRGNRCVFVPNVKMTRMWQICYKILPFKNNTDFSKPKIVMLSMEFIIVMKPSECMGFWLCVFK